MVGGGFMLEDSFDDENMMFQEEDVFDKIEDLLDFDKIEDMQLLHDRVEHFQEHHHTNMPLPKSDFLSSFKCDIDVAELEWLSNFVEDSFSPTADMVLLPNLHTDNDNKDVADDHDLQDSFSPVSVLQRIDNGGGAATSASYSSSSSPTSSSSFSSIAAAINKPQPAVVRGRAPRSKRPRPHVPMVPAASSPHPELVNDCKEKRLKTTNGIDDDEEEKAMVRKCLHCEIEKTPQWRAGPMGPKTLCNACGVRYKSGRLFPEYRPSASPTFVASLHSNSHKMVVEMRVKSSHTKATQTTSLPVSAKGCELLNYINKG